MKIFVFVVVVLVVVVVAPSLVLADEEVIFADGFEWGEGANCANPNCAICGMEFPWGQACPNPMQVISWYPHPDPPRVGEEFVVNSQVLCLGGELVRAFDWGDGVVTSSQEGGEYFTHVYLSPGWVHVVYHVVSGCGPLDDDIVEWDQEVLPPL